MEQVLWFGWFRADIIAEYASLFWRGLQMTIIVTLICIVQGTPLFVQILLIHFAVMPLFVNPADGLLISGEAARNIKQNYGAFLSGVVALTLNSGAYISEVFRAGIQSIDRGQ